MESNRPIVVSENTFRVGEKSILEGMSPLTQFCVIFEDDGETGYFYGLDTSKQDQRILDAMHIYNVRNVVDAEHPSLFQIVWSADGMKAALYINTYPHAVFDFENRRGDRRTNSPSANLEFTTFSHEWSDEALVWFN